MKLYATDPDIQTLVLRIQSDQIDLQPDFQRQEVWSLPKKRKLIDTVLREWSIPPIHLVQLEDRTQEVLDGQQRLATLRDFLNDKFSVDSRITPPDENLFDLHGMFYSSLPEPVRLRVNQFSIRCYNIIEYSPEEPSELFYRLNQPTTLTAGEQRNALYGPARVQLKDAVDYFEDLGNERATIGFSNSRLAYDDVIARLLFFLDQGTISVKATEQSVSERFREQKGFDDRVISRAYVAIQLFSENRRWVERVRLNKASLLSLLLFFARFGSSRTYEEFLGRFYGSESGGREPADIAEAIDLFRDRSSLRVTDVSSVVFRDFCLFYCYFRWFVGPLPASIDDSLLVRALEQFSEDNISFEEVLRGIDVVEKWGRL